MRVGKLTVNVVETDDDMAAVLRIRKKVFQHEQKESYREDRDGNDWFGATHIIAKSDGMPIGCMRVRWYNQSRGGTVFWEKFAILSEWRGTDGLFDLIADFVEQVSRRLGAKRIMGTVQRKGLLRRWQRRGFTLTDQPPAIFAGKEYNVVERRIHSPKPDPITVDRLVGNRPASLIPVNAHSSTVLSPSWQDDRYNMSDMNTLYRSVWGDSIHWAIWLTRNCSFQGAIRHAKCHMAQALLLQPNSRILEVAAGTGESSRFFAREYGCHVTATNYSQQHLSEATKLADQQGMDQLVENSFADFHDLKQFPDKTFDGYLIQEAINHATDKARVLGEAFRVLRPGGRIVVSDQTTDVSLLDKSLRQRLAARHGSQDLFSSGEYLEVMRDTGFEIVRIDDLSDHIGRVFRSIVRRIDDDYEHLIKILPKDLVDFNRENWMIGGELSEAGALGWHVFVADRPY